MKADIDPQLSYPPRLPPGCSVANGDGISAYGDHRVMFDPYRKVFWIYAMAKNVTVIPTDSPTVIKFPAIKMARRDKAAVAVSVSEDPRDGFLTCWSLLVSHPEVDSRALTVTDSSKLLAAIRPDFESGRVEAIAHLQAGERWRTSVSCMHSSTTVDTASQ